MTLPNLVLLEDSNGVWADYLEEVYRHFSADFIRTSPRWPGKRVGLKRQPLFANKESTFWHFISEGDIEEDRLPDIRRCERIRWPRALIDSFTNQRPPPDAPVIWWKNTRKEEGRYVLSLPDFSYVVIVADRGTYVLPWTAYCVPYTHSQGKLRKEFEAYWAQNG